MAAELTMKTNLPFLSLPLQPLLWMLLRLVAKMVMMWVTMVMTTTTVMVTIT